MNIRTPLVGRKAIVVNATWPEKRAQDTSNVL